MGTYALAQNTQSRMLNGQQVSSSTNQKSFGTQTDKSQSGLVILCGSKKKKKKAKNSFKKVKQKQK